jgi:hypothetical protein
MNLNGCVYFRAEERNLSWTCQPTIALSPSHTSVHLLTPNTHNAPLFRLHMLPPDLSIQAIPYRQPVLVLPSLPRLLLDSSSRLLRFLGCLFQHADALGDFPDCIVHAHISGGRAQCSITLWTSSKAMREILDEACTVKDMFATRCKRVVLRCRM